MKKLIKLTLVSLLVLQTACSEPANQEKQARERGHTTEFISNVLHATSAEFVAGLAPNQRPAGAPVILEFAPGADWRTRSLAGVSEPIPASLGFLDSQGAWYTPFNQPGMQGYYDLRNWHHGTRNSNNGNQ